LARQRRADRGAGAARTKSEKDQTQPVFRQFPVHRRTSHDDRACSRESRCRMRPEGLQVAAARRLTWLNGIVAKKFRGLGARIGGGACAGRSLIFAAASPGLCAPPFGASICTRTTPTPACATPIHK